MVQSLDFTLGIVVGAVIGVISSFIANYLTYTFRERKRHERVVRAFISELVMIRDDIKLGTPIKSLIVGTPVFSKLITEMPLLKEGTSELLLNTYSDIKFYLRPGKSVEQQKELEKAIETSISFLRKELENKWSITRKRN